MNWKRILRNALWTMSVLVLLASMLMGGVWWYLHPALHRTNAIAYGKRGQETLALDVLRPAKPNGVGVLLLVSFAWSVSRVTRLRED